MCTWFSSRPNDRSIREFALWMWPQLTERSTDQRDLFFGFYHGRSSGRMIGKWPGCGRRAIDGQPQWSKIWPLRPRWACEFTYVVLAGTSEGLAGPRVLEGAHCRCCSTEWSSRINFSGNPSQWWRQGRKASGSNLETTLLCLWLLISRSLSHLTCVYILLALIVIIFICLIYNCD